MIQLFVPDSFSAHDTVFLGRLYIPARDQRFVIESVTLTLAEHQFIGRGRSQRKVEHTMGQLVTGKNQYIKAGDAFDLSFNLPYHYIMSPAEQAAKNNLKDRFLVWLLRHIRSVKSEFSLVVLVKMKHDSIPYTLNKVLKKI
jgi:hypothetical protein